MCSIVWTACLRPEGPSEETEGPELVWVSNFLSHSIVMLQAISLTIGVLVLFHMTLYYTNTDLMVWFKANPVHYLFPQESENSGTDVELTTLREELEKKINEYKHA